MSAPTDEDPKVELAEARDLLQQIARQARNASLGAGEMLDLEELPREVAEISHLLRKRVDELAVARRRIEEMQVAIQAERDRFGRKWALQVCPRCGVEMATEDAGERAAPSPEMVEVPANHFEPGDTITITALAGPGTAWSRGGSTGVPWEQIDLLKAVCLYNLAEPAKVTVTRPAAPPLPTEPGAVGTATVRGVKSVRVMRIFAETNPDRHSWVTAGLISSAEVWLGNAEISDYVPLLDGTGTGTEG